MIQTNDLEKLAKLAQEYQVGKLYLFGSTLKLPEEKTKDYDLAVEGIAPDRFFSFYGDLIELLTKPVDLVDLSGSKSKFKVAILSESQLIYERSNS